MTTIGRLRAERVPWPVPNRQGHPSCPLCGLSAMHFGARYDDAPSMGWRVKRLEEHIVSPHSHCKDCGRVMGTHRLLRHRQDHHRYPTIPIPGLEDVA